MSASTTTKRLLASCREDILRIAHSYGARNIRVFGSVMRDETAETSDIDFLIDMEPNRGLLDIVALRNELTDLLGRQADVVTEDGLYWLLRRKILREARPL